jgi:hypothetical protein
VTFGAALEKTVPDVPSAQRVGIEPSLAAYEAQSGVGAAMPTQAICCTALGKPVLSSAEPMDCAVGVLWNMPMPPRTTARGPRTAPWNAAICAAVP